MELRDIEVFLTLAEELHFGRTAERLHVTPARVSQAIKKQERAIGAELFERTTRAVRLTPIGEQLRDDLELGYCQIRQAIGGANTANSNRNANRNTHQTSASNKGRALPKRLHGRSYNS